MTISAADLRSASLLSQAAYKNSNGLLTFLDGSGWRPLGSDPIVSGPFQEQELPAPNGLSSAQWDSYFGESASDSNFLFNFGNGQAFIARNEIDNSLAIAFRGSSLEDFVADIINGATTFLPLYNNFHYLINSLQQYITANNITKVLVTGHSLGAVMAEWFMADHPPVGDVEYVGVTFGSPSDAALNGVPDTRLINIGHHRDPVVNSALFAEDPGPRDVHVDRPDEPDDYSLLEIAALASASVDYGQHMPWRYNDTAQSIAYELQRNLNDQRPFDVSAFSYVLGTDPAKTDLYGSSGANVIIGDSGRDTLWGYDGNDILDGLFGNDRFIGGGGNDIIYGGSGNDTAIYSQSVDSYDVTIQGTDLIISPKPFALQFEGSDTVAKDVETFEFNGTPISRADLIARTSAGNVGSDGDQSGVTDGGYSGGGTGTTTNGADVIPGDISSTFVIGATGQALTSAIETAGDKDYVTAYFVQGDTYRILMQGDANHGYAALQDSFFRVRDEQNNILASPSDQPGSDQLDYTATYTGWHYISIGAGGPNYATLTGGYSLTVTLINAPTANSAPVANTDDFGVQYGQTITGNVLVNDTDADQNTLTVDFLSSYHTGLGGIVDLLPNGAFQYIAPGSGPTTAQDSFTYTVYDGAGGSAVGTVHLNLSQPGGGALFTTGDDYSTVPTGGGIYHALSGNDVVFGSTYSEIIYGDDGNDFLHGLDGNDVLYGGNGDDGLIGGPGDDWLVPGPGTNQQIWGDGVSTDFGGFDTVDYSDATGAITVDMLQGTVTGSGASDHINGVDGLVGSNYADFIHVYTTPLRVYGGGGNDLIVGWTLDDEFHAGAGDDELQGQDGNDHLFGDDGNDTLYGGDGNDILDGGAGDDNVYGEAGDDYMFAGSGNDLLRGNDGTDTVDFSLALAGFTSLGVVPGWGTTALQDDEILIATPFADNFSVGAFQEVHLGAGDDVVTTNQVSSVYGDDGNDTIFALDAGKAYGGAGDDVLIALASTTELHGDDGNDNLSGGDGVDHKYYGGAGDDILSGANGNEILSGDTGADKITGGAGNDTILGGSGEDTLTGGSGTDIFVFDAASLPEAQAATPVIDEIKDYDQGGGGNYSAAEGDQIDLSTLLSTAYAQGTGQPAGSLVRAIQDSSGTFANLQVDPDGTANDASWTTIAKLDGLQPGNALSVILDTSLPAGASIGVAGITAADLTASNLSVDDTTATLGQSITISYDLSNVGSVDAAGFDVGFYVSTDPIIDVNDELFAYQTITSQAANSSTHHHGIAPLPNDLTPGVTYYIGVVVDDTNLINETSEGNNASNSDSIIIAQANQPPSAVTLTNTTASIAENTSTASHIKVADITVTDDGLGSNTLGLGGADAAFFEIVGYALYLKAGTALNFEAKASYAVAVTVDDTSVGSAPDATSATYNLAVASAFTAGPDAVTLITPGMTWHALGGDDHVTGTSGADTIYGDEGNDQITGGLGNDTIYGGDSNDRIVATQSDGNDQIMGGKGFDILDYSAVGGPVQVNQLAGTTTGAAGNDVLLGTMEQIFGTNFDDVLSGSHGINVLNGLGGNDKFFGNKGHDLMRGGDGNDTFYFSTSDGADSLQGGTGWDTLDYSSLAGPVQVNQLAGTTTGNAGNDTLLDLFEQVIGTKFNDVLSGSHGINALNGGGGDDRIFCNNGNDWCTGGTGNDTITLGSGNDVFQFYDGNGSDIVTDFVAGPGVVDRINLIYESSVSDFADVMAAAHQNGADTVIDFGGGDMITLLNVNMTHLNADDFVV